MPSPIWLLVLCLLATPARSQVIATIAESAPMILGLSRLCGDNAAFTARGQLHSWDNNRKEAAALPVTFAMLDRAVRVELDLSRARVAGPTVPIVALLKQLGLDQIVLLLRPGQTNLPILFPAIEACLDVPFSPETTAEAARWQNHIRFARTPLGRETLGARSCAKQRVMFTGGADPADYAVVWNAADLAGLPIKLQLFLADGITQVQFTDIKMQKPDRRIFERPPGYVRLSSEPAIVQFAIKKRLAGGTAATSR